MLIRQFVFLFVLGVTGASAGQSAPRTPEEVVRLGIERSRAVAVARAKLREAEASARSLRSAINPRIEVAPGTGFTNSNAFLSQEFDLSGSRGAQAARATADAAKARAELGVAVLDVAAEVRRAYFRLSRAQQAHRLAAELATTTSRFRELVKRKVELGDAPQVQAMRAELESERARVSAERASAERSAASVELASLMGAPVASFEDIELQEVLPARPPNLEALLPSAKTSRPEAAAARAQIDASQADLRFARARFGPTLFADVAADVWSLDRHSWRSDNLGFQIRLGMPIFDRGELRSGERAARAGLAASEALASETERRIDVEIRQAHTLFLAQLSAARGYSESIAPKAKELLDAELKGYEAGLVSFLEVLEAQRAYSALRFEALDAFAAAYAAETDFLRAIGSIPGASLDAPAREANP